MSVVSSLVVAALAAWWLLEEPRAMPHEPLPQAVAGDETRALLPLPDPPAPDPIKVELGRRLFADKRLSHDNTVACISCHDLAHGGADPRPVSIGVGGRRGTRNAPTVFNASLNFVQFWDGRAATLEQQAAGPVHNPDEMASSWAEIVPRLAADARYAAAFRAAYADGITGANVADAIAAFERTLLTPDSRFDRFLRGERSALDAREQAGMQRFVNYGCASCHQGAAIGGNMFQRFGVMELHPPPQAARDTGRQAITGRPQDRWVYKVPSLRNVALTAPYFHDASAPTLEEAVATMGRVQLGRRLSDEDVTLIVAFLHTLTGTWQGKSLQ